MNFIEAFKDDPDIAEAVKAILETEVPRRKGKTIGELLRDHPQWDSQQMNSLLQAGAVALIRHCTVQESVAGFRYLAGDLTRIQRLCKKTVALNVSGDLLEPDLQRAMLLLAKRLPGNVKSILALADHPVNTPLKKAQEFLRFAVNMPLLLVGVDATNNALDTMICDMAKKLNAPKTRTKPGTLRVARFRRRKA